MCIVLQHLSKNALILLYEDIARREVVRLAEDTGASHAEPDLFGIQIAHVEIVASNHGVFDSEGIISKIT